MESSHVRSEIDKCDHELFLKLDVQFHNFFMQPLLGELNLQIPVGWERLPNTVQTYGIGVRTLDISRSGFNEILRTILIFSNKNVGCI